MSNSIELACSRRSANALTNSVMHSSTSARARSSLHTEFLESKLRDECRDTSRQKQVYKADGGGLPKTETVYPLVPARARLRAWSMR
jgi:hypothetical protein